MRQGLPPDTDDVDLKTLQTRLRAERARLADEIEGRLSTSSKGSAGLPTTQVNPFATVRPPTATAKDWSQRPVKLGLGAELVKNGESSKGILSQTSGDKRLKGLIAGKRKRADAIPADVERSHDGADDEDSRGGIISNGMSSQASSVAQRSVKDPFAGRKMHKKPDTGSQRQIVAVTDRTTLGRHDAPQQSPATDSSAMSKSARKRLRKKLQKDVNHTSQSPSKELDVAPLNTARNTTETADSAMHDPALPPLQVFGDPKGGQGSLQRLLPAKLAGARFRQINETLYTSPSSDAMQLIKDDPEKLVEYHEGFREQVKGWPKIPVRQIFDLIHSAQKHAASSRDHTSGKGNGMSQAKKSGRSASGALIADLGAGEGFLAKWLAKENKTGVRVLSYDLLSSNDGWVIGSDIAHVGGLPLPGRALVPSLDQSDSGDGDEEDKARVIDVAVFCLSLMATNWVDKIREASRILRPNGELIIAEVTSRFSDLEQFIRLVESLGFTREHSDSSNTHFILLTFTKMPTNQITAPFADAAQLTRLVEHGSTLLKPCIYKRR